MRTFFAKRKQRFDSRTVYISEHNFLPYSIPYFPLFFKIILLSIAKKNQLNLGSWTIGHVFFVLGSKETQVYRFLKGGHIAYIFFAARAQIDLFSMKTGNKIQA